MIISINFRNVIARCIHVQLLIYINLISTTHTGRYHMEDLYWTSSYPKKFHSILSDLYWGTSHSLSSGPTSKYYHLILINSNQYYGNEYQYTLKLIGTIWAEMTSLNTSFKIFKVWFKGLRCRVLHHISWYSCHCKSALITFIFLA